MSSKNTRTETGKITRVAKKLKAKGYAVKARSKQFAKPTKVEGVTPDIVAKKGNETVIVEVTSHKNLQANRKELSRLAAYAEKRPGYRVDIFVTRPVKTSSSEDQQQRPTRRRVAKKK